MGPTSFGEFSSGSIHHLDVKTLRDLQDSIGSKLSTNPGRSSSMSQARNGKINGG